VGARRHPEWWPLCLGGLAWLVLAARAPRHTWIQNIIGGAPINHAGMSPSAPPTLWLFGLMIVAMLVPGMAGSIRATVAASLWRRRQRALAEYLGGYFAVWMIATAPLLGAISLTLNAGHYRLNDTVTAVALVAAALWQLTPANRRALNAHRRTRPLAPMGAAPTAIACAQVSPAGASASSVADR
jgi:hypothetical protein